MSEKLWYNTDEERDLILQTLQTEGKVVLATYTRVNQDGSKTRAIVAGTPEELSANEEEYVVRKLDKSAGRIIAKVLIALIQVLISKGVLVQDDFPAGAKTKFLELKALVNKDSG